MTRSMPIAVLMSLIVVACSSGSASELLKAGEDVVLVVDGFTPGVYPFYCTVHVGVGMKGTLTVT